MLGSLFMDEIYERIKIAGETIVENTFSSLDKVSITEELVSGMFFNFIKSLPLAIRVYVLNKSLKPLKEAFIDIIDKKDFAIDKDRFLGILTRDYDVRINRIIDTKENETQLINSNHINGKLKFSNSLRKVSQKSFFSEPENNCNDTVEIGNVSYQKNIEHYEAESIVNNASFCFFPKELLARLQQKDKSISFEEFDFIECELVNYVERGQKTLYDEWFAYAMLANHLRAKIELFYSKKEKESCDVIKCLENYEKSFKLANQLNLDGNDLDWIANEKEEYCTILNSWTLAYVDRLMFEEDVNIKINHFRILEERLVNGIYFGNKSHEKFVDFTIKLNNIREILSVYGEEAAGIDLIYEKDKKWFTLRHISHYIMNFWDTLRKWFVKLFLICMNRAYFTKDTKKIAAFASVSFLLIFIVSLFFWKTNRQSAATNSILPRGQEKQIEKQLNIKKQPTMPNIPTLDVERKPLQSENAASMPAKISYHEREVEQTLPSVAPSDSKTSLYENLPSTKTYSASTVIEQQEKTINSSGQMRVTPTEVVSDKPPQADTNGQKNIISTQTLKDVSSASDKFEKRLVDKEKERSVTRKRCGALYEKLSVGKVLKAEEGKFLLTNCN
jgi:hypothetical protein